jgi:hypothetical protein
MYSLSLKSYDINMSVDLVHGDSRPISLRERVISNTEVVVNIRESMPSLTDGGGAGPANLIRRRDLRRAGSHHRDTRE